MSEHRDLSLLFACINDVFTLVLHVEVLIINKFKITRLLE